MIDQIVSYLLHNKNISSQLVAVFSTKLKELAFPYPEVLA